MNLQVAASLVPLPAARQHVGYTLTGDQLGSTSISFTYSTTRLFSRTRVLDTRKVLDQIANYSIAAALWL